MAQSRVSFINNIVQSMVDNSRYPVLAGEPMPVSMRNEMKDSMERLADPIYTMVESFVLDPAIIEPSYQVRGAFEDELPGYLSSKVDDITIKMDPSTYKLYVNKIPVGTQIITGGFKVGAQPFLYANGYEQLMLNAESSPLLVGGNNMIPTSRAVKVYVDSAIQGIVGGGGIGNMLKSTYDTNQSGRVDDSERLNTQLPSYYLAWANFTGKPTTEAGYGIIDGFTSWNKDYNDLINNPPIPPQYWNRMGLILEPVNMGDSMVANDITGNGIVKGNQIIVDGSGIHPSIPSGYVELFMEYLEGVITADSTVITADSTVITADNSGGYGGGNTTGVVRSYDGVNTNDLLLGNPDIGNSFLMIKSTGNIGIGVKVPNEKLHVNGWVNVLNGYKIAGNDIYITKDLSNNLTFTDIVTGTKTLAELAAGGGGSYIFRYSLVESTGNVNLVNDADAPGNSKLYGTNSSGVKGWYDIPTGGTPDAHHLTHEDGGADEISVAGLNGVLANAQTPISHDLVSLYHTATGLTAGHFLKAIDGTTFGFATHGLTYTDVGAAAASHNHAQYELSLGNPAVDGYVLTSTALGVRSWVSQTGGMVYPGVGIPLSTGSAWGTSITNNSANWNTAYGWGNHSGLYLPIGGGTLTGALNMGSNQVNFNLATTGSKAIEIIAENRDINIWEVNYGASPDYGYYLRYMGTGLGNFNSLQLWTHGETGNDVLVYNVNQDGTITFNISGLFSSSGLLLYNPAKTYQYIIAGSAITANRTITIPLLTGNDTLVTAAFTQILTNKTINATNNIISDTSQAIGDILKNNGSKFIRFGRGTALQVLRVNSGGTDLEWADPSGGGITPVDSTLLDWVTDRYQAYSTKQLGGEFYTGTTNPDQATRLNYNGYFYATRFYALNIPNNHIVYSSNNLLQGNSSFTYSSESLYVAGTNTTASIVGYNTSTGSGGIFQNSSSGYGIQASSTTSIAARLVQASVTLNATGNVVSIERINGGTNNFTGDMLSIIDNPSTSGTISGSALKITLGTTIRVDFNPRVVTGASAVAYFLDTHNNLTTTGAKLLSLRNQGVEKLYVTKDGDVYANGILLGSGGGVGGSGANTRVAYWTAANTIAGDSDFYWDGGDLNITEAGSSPTVLGPNSLVMEQTIGGTVRCALLPRRGSADGVDWAYLFDTNSSLGQYKLASFRVNGSEVFFINSVGISSTKVRATNFVWRYIIGDTALISHDTEVSTDATSYTKLKTITLGANVNTNTTLRIKFDLRVQTGDGPPVYGKIYKNGIAVGTQREDTNGTYITFSQDITNCNNGDTIELWAYNYSGDPAYTAFVRNFRVCGSHNNTMVNEVSGSTS